MSDSNKRFICQFALDYTKPIELELAHIFYCAEKMYNKTGFYALNNYYKMLKDNDYVNNLNNYKNTKEALEKEKNKIKIKELKDLLKLYSDNLKYIRETKYGLSEYNLQKYINVQRKKSYMGVLDVDTTQKIATRVWESMSKIIFGDGKKFHFKHNDLDSIESKKNSSGIRFDKESLCLKYKKLVIPIKIRKRDYYAKEALTREICYCRIIRKPFKKDYKYFLQIVFKGIPPIKNNLKIGKGKVGIDLGTSTIAAVGNKESVFEPLAPNINKYNKRIINLQRKINRSLQINNPDKFNKDGTIKKGVKLYKTNNCKKLIQKLKNEYRKKSIYIKEEHNKLANKILSLGDEFITEEMDFKALQKRAKTSIEKQEKKTIMVSKDGTKKEIKKYKKKKRYGKSLNNHAPSSLVKTMETKLSYFGKELIKVNTKKYKASQYHHDSDTYIKSSLKERFKVIEGKKVQRDLYSAYLIKNKLDNETINRDKCKKDFKKFVKINNKLIEELMLREENLPECMGIKELNKNLKNNLK